MIDIEKAKEIFKKYVSRYNLQNGKILLKYNHILRVMKISGDIARNLNLTQEDIVLAELIGLLHDIGRFEQVKRYNTFNDSRSIDHGKFALEILFEEGLINDFNIDEKYYSIIKKAIFNHNKERIEDGLDERTLLHSKIIRDSDKLDIFYVIITDETINSYNKENMQYEVFSNAIINDFYERHLIDYKKIETAGDLWIAHMAYVFDFYFKKSYITLKEKNYLNMMFSMMNFQNEKTKSQAEEILKYTIEYVERKCNE